MTPVEILRGAKVELARRGLHKGGYFAVPVRGDEIPDGPCCLRGACVAAAHDWNGDEGEVFIALQNAAADMGFASPVCFNDRPEATFDDVQAFLDRAIALAEGK